MTKESADGISTEIETSGDKFSPVDHQIVTSLARQTFFIQLGQVDRPSFAILGTEIMEILPRVDAGIMHVVEANSHGIVADGVNLHDRDRLLASDSLALVRAVSLDFRAGAADAEIFRPKCKGLSVIKRNGQLIFRWIEGQLSGPHVAGSVRCHGCSSPIS